MTGKTSLKRQGVGTTAIDVVMEKRRLGMKRAVVPLQATIPAEAVLKTGAAGTAYAGKAQIQIRRMGRGGPTETSSRARALKGCKGKRGCDFVECVREALGRVPHNLAKACPTRA